MQDAIILYENGKAIGGEGHSTNASDITFDNTGTDLVSENVEDAIKEVNDKYAQKSVIVEANGTKTNAQGLNELFALIDMSKVSGKSVVRKGSEYFPIYQITSTLIIASIAIINSNQTYSLYMLTIQSSSSKLERNVAGTYTNLASNVLSGDLEFIY